MFKVTYIVIIAIKMCIYRGMCIGLSVINLGIFLSLVVIKVFFLGYNQLTMTILITLFSIVVPGNSLWITVSYLYTRKMNIPSLKQTDSVVIFLFFPFVT